jgi:hypothetical protein
MKLIKSDMWDGDFEGRFDDREHAIGFFHRHVADVKANVPADRLLVFDVRQGWEPLCEFLDVPVPQDQPFPRLNDREAFRARLESGDLKK